MYQPGVCTNQVCVLSRSVYQPGVCTNQEYVLVKMCTNLLLWIVGNTVLHKYILTNLFIAPMYVGFAVNVSLLVGHPKAWIDPTVPTGHLETSFLSQLVTKSELEPKANMCKEVCVCVPVCEHVFVHACVCVHVRVHACMRVCSCMCIHYVHFYGTNVFRQSSSSRVFQGSGLAHSY